jgi:hypothetical protein
MIEEIAFWITWGLLFIGTVLLEIARRKYVKLAKESGRVQYSINEQLLFQVDSNPDLVIDPILQAEITNIRNSQPMYKALSEGKFKLALKEQQILEAKGN